MAVMTFEVKISNPGEWLVNLFNDWVNPGNTYEIVSPDKIKSLDISAKTTYATLSVSAPEGTTCELWVGSKMAISGVTNHKNLFMGHCRIK